MHRTKQNKTKKEEEENGSGENCNTLCKIKFMYRSSLYVFPVMILQRWWKTCVHILHNKMPIACGYCVEP